MRGFWKRNPMHNADAHSVRVVRNGGPCTFLQIRMSVSQLHTITPQQMHIMLENISTERLFLLVPHRYPDGTVFCDACYRIRCLIMDWEAQQESVRLPEASITPEQHERLTMEASA